jgi:hypothetical protein
MWTEILGGISLLTIMFTLLTMQNKKIDKKMSAEVCHQRGKNIENSFNTIKDQQKKCEHQFSEITNKIDSQQKLLIEVKTILDIAANKNGWK